MSHSRVHYSATRTSFATIFDVSESPIHRLSYAVPFMSIVVVVAVLLIYQCHNILTNRLCVFHFVCTWLCMLMRISTVTRYTGSQTCSVPLVLNHGFNLSAARCVVTVLMPAQELQRHSSIHMSMYTHINTLLPSHSLSPSHTQHDTPTHTQIYVA